MLAFAEGLLLAKRSGIDPQGALDVMEASPIGSPPPRLPVGRAEQILGRASELGYDRRDLAALRGPGADRGSEGGEGIVTTERSST
jgi:hypothetical protein